MARILLKCHDVIGKTMAGPAIRYWEFAKALSKKHKVTLAVPNSTSLTSNNFLIDHTDNLNFSHYDVIISQVFDPKTVVKAKYHGLKLILDAYDPEPLEHLEIFKKHSLNTRIFLNRKIIDTMSYSFKMADGFLCANKKQQDLWTGFLLALKKIDPILYDEDSSLKNTIGVVPFGISKEPPVKNKTGFRKQFDLKGSDKLIVWGGGIWNWFDPLTLISAMKIIKDKRDDIKLVFMGIVHPNAAAMPAMSMAYETKKMADTFQLTDNTVFFNDSWIAYQERSNYLLEADIGISTHFEHLETKFSFRTRLLDYLWAGLPIVATDGDVFAEMIKSEKLGLTVAPNDSVALADAILKIVNNDEDTKKFKANIQKFKESFYWDNIVDPIDDMVGYLNNQARSKLKISDIIDSLVCLFKKLSPYSLISRTKIYLNRILNDS